MKSKTVSTTAMIARQGRMRMVASLVAYVVAASCMIPAIMVNLDNAAGSSLAWQLAAGGLVVGSAIFIEAGKLHLADRQRLTGVVFILAGIFCLLLNAQNALTNAVATSDHRSDHRAAIIASAQKTSSQRDLWSQGRTEAAQAAGATSPDEFEAEIQRLMSADAKRWQSTDECDPLKTTASMSREFCSSIAELRRKKAAAAKRDELDAKIANLDEQTRGVPVVSSVDPYADNLAEFLSLFGYQFSDDQKRILGRSKDWVKPIGLELMATLCPWAVLSLFSFMFGHRERNERAPPRVPPKRPSQQSRAIEPTKPEVVIGDDPIHQFIAESLEHSPGSIMKAGEMWSMWTEWCQRKGLTVGSQRAFGLKLQRTFAHDKNNNRPRYLNVRVKPPALRLAVSNA